MVDTGFTAEVSARRGRTHLRCPIETLRELDIDPDTVDDVVLTHLHYDHVGNFHKFAKARFHLQTREMGFVTGPYMRYPKFGHSFEVEDVVGMVKLNFKGRVVLCGGISQYNSTNPTGPVNYLTLLTQRARMEGFIITDYAPRFAEGVKRRARRGHRRPCGTP